MYVCACCLQRSEHNGISGDRATGGCELPRDGLYTQLDVPVPSATYRHYILHEGAGLECLMGAPGLLGV